MSEIHVQPEQEDTTIIDQLRATSKGIEVKVLSKDIGVNEKKLSVLTREASVPSPKGDVLFLHGGSFTSKNWEEIDTLRLVAAMGYRAVAVDLPGYGSTKGNITTDEHAIFMENLISVLELTAPVIVSPSASGEYSLPYLMKDPNKGANRARGFVPIGTMGAERYSEINYEQFQVPTAAIYGENDRYNPEVSKERFRRLPKHEIFIIQNARHAVYMNQPDTFHKTLYKFLHDVFDSKFD